MGLDITDIWQVVTIRKPDGSMYDEGERLEALIFLDEQSARDYYETQEWVDLETPSHEFSVWLCKSISEGEYGEVTFELLEERDIQNVNPDLDEE